MCWGWITYGLGEQRVSRHLALQARITRGYGCGKGGVSGGVRAQRFGVDGRDAVIGVNTRGAEGLWSRRV